MLGLTGKESELADNREQMMKWLPIAGTVVKYLAYVMGIVVGIFVIFGRENVISHLQQYLPIFLIVAVIFAFYAYVAYGTWFFGREIWRGIRGWLQKRRDSRQLRLLAPRLAVLKQNLHWRSSHSHPTDDLTITDGWTNTYFDTLIDPHRSLKEELRKLNISSPYLPERPLNNSRIEEWAGYLDMLLPLATVGNVNEARGILSRMEE